MNRLDWRTALLMTMPPLLWAGNAVVGRLLVGSVAPLTLNFLRWGLAGLILLPLAWRVFAKPRDILSRWRHLLLLGVLGVGSYNALLYLALVTTTPINVTLIAASSPLWTLAIGALVYRVRPTARQYAGAAFSFGGVLLVIARGDLLTLIDVHLVRGDLYVVAAAVCWGFYGWMLARPPASMRAPDRPDWNWAEALMAQVVFGVAAAGLAAGVEQQLGVPDVRWSPGVVVALAYLAIAASIVAFRCWGLGVQRAGPTVASFFANLTPLFATLMSAALIGEGPRGYHAAAFVLIVAGIVVSSTRRSTVSVVQ